MCQNVWLHQNKHILANYQLSQLLGHENAAQISMIALYSERPAASFRYTELYTQLRLAATAPLKSVKHLETCWGFVHLLVSFALSSSIITFFCGSPLFEGRLSALLKTQRLPFVIHRQLLLRTSWCISSRVILSFSPHDRPKQSSFHSLF